MQEVDYKEIAKKARLSTLALIYNAGTSHIGSNFSAIDIMTVLFENVDMKKDEAILSAGWKAAAWYYFLWRKGVITEEELLSFCQEIECPNCKNLVVGCKRCNNTRKIQSPWIGLVEPMNRWGLRFAGGSMGYGLPFAVGVALAKKMKGEEGKVYCLMSDGELNSGTIWESALIANQHNLNNLIVIVDRNHLQAMGNTKDILDTEPLAEKFESFGWTPFVVDGHIHKDIESFFLPMNDMYIRPKIIIAATVKGKGVSFFERNNDWHYRVVDSETYELAKKELGV